MAEPTPDRLPLRTAALSDREHCRLPASVLDAHDLQVGRQVRLRRDDLCALYTVVGADEDVVVSPEGRDRLGARGPVAVDPTVITPPDEGVAGSLVESVSAGGGHLVTCAPHGGGMEAWTDEQAERLADWVGGTAWVCRGHWPGWEAFDRWHVTSNDVHPDSFPGLGRVAERAYERAVSFHAWRKEGIGVGGAAPRDLRTAVRDAIADAVDDSVRVELATDPRYRGDRPGNLVNWLTADGESGVQIEQGRAVREDHRDEVVEAVADVVDGWER